MVKDIWYGDQRDVVKWSVLLHLADTEGLELIAQVAFFRKERPLLETPEGNLPIHDRVWEHFRDIKTVENTLGPVSGLEVVVLDKSFENVPRKEYVAWAAERLQEMVPGKVVLLDPDTGMEPPGGAEREHVKIEEVEYLWQALNPDDWMVLYQHRWRDKGWEVDAKSRFEKAVGTEVKTFKGVRIAPDVAFFAARKQ